MRSKQSTTSAPGTKTPRSALLGWLFCAVSLLAVGSAVFMYLPLSGRSTIWVMDGLTQHFPALYQTNLMLRGLLSGKGLQLWSFHLGFGGDLIGALSYYLADPFALLSLAVPMAKLEYAYEWLYFLRLLVAGLAGYAYLRKMGAKMVPSVAGSITYVFTTFTLFSALRHPYFADPLVWFPLVVLGIELVLDRRRPYLLIAAVFLSALSSFYFFYQISIIAIIYAVARYIEVTPKAERWKRLAPEGLRVAWPYALGTALSAVMLVPVLTAFFASSRSGSHEALGIFYNLNIYRSYLIALTSSEIGGKSLYAGFSILGFLAIPVLFMRRREHAALKFMLLVFPVFLVFPFLGSLINGFAFPCYRFSFMWGLMLAAASALMLSDSRRLTGREVLAMGAGLAAYSAAVIWAAGDLNRQVTPFLVLGALIWSLFAVEALANHERSHIPAHHWLFPALRAAVVALAIAGVVLLGFHSFDSRYSNRLTEYVKRGHVFARYQKNEGSQLAALPGAAVSRADKQQAVYGSDLNVTANNDALVQNYNGISYYYSIASAGIIDYLRGMDDRVMRHSFDYSGLDDRAALEALAGVRYYVARTDGLQYVPYGFVPIRHEGKSTIFENDNRLPLGFVYHSQVASAAYDAMTPLERQQALLQAVVLDPAEKIALPSIVASTGVIDVPFSIDTSGPITLDSSTKRIRTAGRSGRIDLHFTPVNDAELYVDMTGVDFALHGAPPQDEETVSSAGALLGELGQPANLSVAHEPPSLHISAGTVGHGKTERDEPRDLSYYWGDTSALINLGYSRPMRDRAHIRFLEPGLISYKDLHVYAVPMNHFAEQVHALADEGLRDVSIGKDSLSGTVTAKGTGLLYLSIPYSPGWSATVDGEPAEIVHANVGFSGIPLAGGTHRVVLRYRTPGLVAGAAISLVALLGLIGIAGLEWRGRKRQSTGQ